MIFCPSICDVDSVVFCGYLYQAYVSTASWDSDDLVRVWDQFKDQSQHEQICQKYHFFLFLWCLQYVMMDFIQADGVIQSSLLWHQILTIQPVLYFLKHF